MDQAFSMLLTWRNGNPHIVVSKEEGSASDIGPVLTWKDGKPCIMLIEEQPFTIEMPELDSPDEKIPFDIGVISPERLKQFLETPA